MISLDKSYNRVIPGHKMFMPVFIFKKNNTFLTIPYQNNNVFLTTNNSTLSQNIQNIYKCEANEYPILVAKSLADNLNMDLIITLNTYCELNTKEQAWDINYYSSQKQPIHIYRSSLLDSENHWK